MFSTFFTAWGYEVSILEFIAAVTSFVGVYLGTTGKRITWPWWALSSALYGVFFYQVDGTRKGPRVYLQIYQGIQQALVMIMTRLFSHTGAQTSFYL